MPRNLGKNTKDVTMDKRTKKERGTEKGSPGQNSFYFLSLSLYNRLGSHDENSCARLLSAFRVGSPASFIVFVHVFQVRLDTLYSVCVAWSGQHVAIAVKATHTNSRSMKKVPERVDATQTRMRYERKRGRLLASGRRTRTPSAIQSRRRGENVKRGVVEEEEEKKSLLPFTVRLHFLPSREQSLSLLPE